MKNVKTIRAASLMLWVLMLVLTGRTSSAQVQITPEYISFAEGVASPTVNDILQDHYGLIWIATWNGLQKYDGRHFETFKNIPGKAGSLQSNNCWGLMEDVNHDIWVSHENGMSRFDRKKKEFVNYPIGDMFQGITGSAAGRTIRMLQDKKGRIWAATYLLQIIRFDPKTDTWENAKYQHDSIPGQNHHGISLTIAEDSEGGIWAGSATLGLLHLRAGEDTFKIVKPELFRRFRSGNNISGLYSDKDNTLWITSRTGVYKYNPKTGVFKIIVEYGEAIRDSYADWNKIGVDRAGNVWISNNFRGVLKFKGTSDDFEEVSIAGSTRIPNYGWNVTLTNFTVDRSGVFWLGSQQRGVLKYNPVGRPFEVYTHSTGGSTALSSGAYGLLVSKLKPGTVYVGTRGHGLNVLDLNTHQVKQVRIRSESDMFGGSVRAIAETSDGTLWLGTWGDGLIRMGSDFRELKRYGFKSKSAGITSGQVRIIKADNTGKLWLGTPNGLDIFDPATSAFRHVVSSDRRTYSQKLVDELERLAKTDQKVAGIERVTDVQDRKQKVAIKTPGKYAVMVVGEDDPVGAADYGWIERAPRDTIWKMQPFEHSMHAGGASKNRIDIKILDLSPGNYTLRFVTDDSHSYGKFNAAAPDMTSLYGMVLVKLDPQNEALIRALLKSVGSEETITGSNITAIEIGKKYVWVAADESGFNRIDPETGKVQQFLRDPGQKNSLPFNEVLDIYEDPRGMIWLAGLGGLAKFDPHAGKYTTYTESDGLPTNLTISILPGDRGEMWIATENGLSQMVNSEALGKVTFINYNSSDGLGGDTFLARVAGKSAEGQFFFGGDHGLTTFKSFKGNDTPPPVILSNLLISNKSVLDMKENSPLDKDLFSAEQIQLSFDQNNLGFEFAALDYANPGKNQYAHMLKGYDKDWIYDNHNFANYTNLEPGEYEFMVRASNAYGVWNEKGKTLKISIMPPWWQTWWAYAGYVVVFALLIFLTIRYMQGRIRERERERSREKELQHAREIEKAYMELKETQNQLIQSEKMASLGELTAGIAHEIQNPLNFINNFSETSMELLDEMRIELENGNTTEVADIFSDITLNLQKINHHGKRADSIVKGMLLHSRSSAGTKEPTDINSLTDEYIRLGYHGLRAKDQSFNAAIRTDFDPDLTHVRIAPQEIGRVVLNLLNNAFYAVQQKQKEFEGPGYEPTVTVVTKGSGQKVVVSVQDNGNGIPQKALDKIFQPFFTTKPTGQGTGLGLSLSYEIVTKGHGGELMVETTEGKGSIFTIQLPRS